MRENVFNQRTGRLLPPGEPEPWLAGIVEFAGDPARVNELGLAGRRWLETEASPEAFLRGFKAVLGEVFTQQTSHVRTAGGVRSLFRAI
jgi:hypothetical protein